MNLEDYLPCPIRIMVLLRKLDDWIGICVQWKKSEKNKTIDREKYKYHVHLGVLKSLSSNSGSATNYVYNFKKVV